MKYNYNYIIKTELTLRIGSCYITGTGLLRSKHELENTKCSHTKTPRKQKRSPSSLEDLNGAEGEFIADYLNLLLLVLMLKLQCFNRTVSYNLASRHCGPNDPLIHRALAR